MDRKKPRPSSPAWPTAGCGMPSPSWIFAGPTAHEVTVQTVSEAAGLVGQDYLFDLADAAATGDLSRRDGCHGPPGRTGGGI